MADVKVVKADVLKAIAQVVAEDVEVTVGDVVVTGSDIQAYVDTTLEQLAKKAAKAKEKATEKKVGGDALRDKIAALLTDEYKTIAQIVAEIGDESVTAGKVTSRLTQLCKLDLAHKTDVKTEDGRKIKGYAVGTAPVAEAE